MKSKPSGAKGWLVLLLVITLSTGLVAWGFKDTDEGYYGGGDYYQVDTPPTGSKKEKKIRDLDEALDELDRGLLKLEENLKDADWEKIRKQIEESLAKVDANKIKLEVERALKDVDMAKIKKELEESLAKIDGDKIKADIEKAMKEVDVAKIKAEIQQSLKEIDVEKIKAEIDMEKLNVEMKNLEKELKKIGPEIEKSMEDAKRQMQKAKETLKEYKQFVDGLEKDGLINKKDGYKLKHKDGEFFINGKKQSADVYNKYKYFLEKHKSFNISNDFTDNDDFNIDID